MTAITFDTHAAVKRLIKLGYKEAHAEEFVKIFQEGKELDTSNLVTKDFLSARLTQVEKRLIMWFVARLIMWFVGTNIALAAIIVGFLQLAGKV